MKDLHISSMPRLKLVIRGMKRMQAGVPSKPWLPITPEILQRIRAEWNKSKEWDHIMLWAAMHLCFCGFLRAGKVGAPETNFNASQHVTIADIAVDDLVRPLTAVDEYQTVKNTPVQARGKGLHW